MKKHIVLKVALILLAAVVLTIGGYLLYAVTAYHRLPDNMELDIVSDTGETARSDAEYTLVSWNIGFGAYTDDYTFFMDGGKSSRAASRESVIKNVSDMAERIKSYGADFVLIQEVDCDATRTYHVDEKQLLSDALNGFGSVFAINYDSPYLFYPLNEPHGKSLAGLMTLSKYSMSGSTRISLPVETGFSKFLDLDRCYSVTRVPLGDGGEICLYNVHLSAYTTDGTIATEQLKLLAEAMTSDAESGCYVICAGDFNKDLLGDSSEYFGVKGDEYTWAQPIDTSFFDRRLRLVAPFDEQSPVASCRLPDKPYEKGVSFVLTVDGFIVSDNVTVIESRVIDEAFKYSDHNPVIIRFKLAER